DIDFAPGEWAIGRKGRASFARPNHDHAANRRANAGVLGIVPDDALELNLAISPHGFLRTGFIRCEDPFVVVEAAGSLDGHNPRRLSFFGSDGQFAAQLHLDIDLVSVPRLELLGDGNGLVSRQRSVPGEAR